MEKDFSPKTVGLFVCGLGTASALAGLVGLAFLQGHSIPAGFIAGIGILSFKRVTRWLAEKLCPNE